MRIIKKMIKIKQTKMRMRIIKNHDESKISKE